MTPYVDPTYFLLLVYPLLALVVLGVLGRLGRSAVLLVSIAVVLYQYGAPLADAADGSTASRQLILLVIYAGASTILVVAYARAVAAKCSQRVFYGAVALALLPLVVVKLQPLAGGVAHAAGPPGVPAPQSGLLDTGLNDTDRASQSP